MNWPEGYTCRTCGQYHTGLPFSFAADFPDPYANLSKEERDSRATIGSDQCILDSQSFFLRGIMEIPVIGSDQPFLWGVWASIREEIFDELSDCWELEGREKKHGPYKGRLANSLSIYPETLNLKLKIIVQPGRSPAAVCRRRRPTRFSGTAKVRHLRAGGCRIGFFFTSLRGSPDWAFVMGHAPGPTCTVTAFTRSLPSLV